jgi:hypothetical protein
MIAARLQVDITAGQSQPTLKDYRSAPAAAMALMDKLEKKPDVVSGAFLILLGLGIIVFSSIIEVGSFANPGPGLFPLLSGIALTCLSLILLIQSLKLPAVDVLDLSPRSATRVFGLLGAMVLYAIAVDFLGFVIATAFLLFYFLKLISKYPWKHSIFYALLISAGAYALFNSFLDVGLPAGLMNIFRP